MLQKDIGFVIMIEPGDLEWQGIVLISSIKAFCRDSYNIYVYCREDKANNLKKETIDFLSRNSVVFNTIFNDYVDGDPIGNKIIASAQKRDEKVSIFLDTDTAFLKEVCYMDVIDENKVSCVVAGGETWTKNKEDWVSLYKAANIPQPTEKVKLKNNVISFPYFNAGFVCFPNKSKFSEHWLELSKKIDQLGEVKNKRPWLDQVTLPLAIKSCNLKFKELDLIYNQDGNNPNPLDPYTVLVHYHHSMHVYKKGLNKIFSTLLAEYSPFSNFYELHNFYKVKSSI